MSSKEIDPEKDFRYLRPGHVDLERPCDTFVKRATKLIPGTGVLPRRWAWKSTEIFNETYEDLGPVVWAQTASYHLLLIEGEYVFRLWTDSPKTSLVDISEHLARTLSDQFEILKIPPKTKKKTKPFTYRIRLTKQKEVDILMLKTLLVYRLV